jgi:C4-dicarboxylate transporter, DctQ subunit
MTAFWRSFDELLNGMAAMAGVILVFICAAVCYTIGMRFFFTRTTIWLMQTTEYALLWIVFLATAWLLKEKGHITTDIIYGGLNDRAKAYFDSILFILSAIACAVCLYYGSTYTYRCVAEHITDVRGVTVPKAAIFFIIPFGFLTLTIQFMRMAWDRVVELKGSV